MNSLTPTDRLIQAVLDCGLPAVCRLQIAVSGGPDSTALLDTAAHIAGEHRPGWQVRAAHINHALRGEASETDEAFVRSLCRDLDVALDVVSVDTRDHARTRHLSIETAAREQRYAALDDLRRAWNGDVTLTGHTADDQTETLLMRLTRGTGLSGLMGVRARNGALVRPFLSVRHETVLAALQSRGLGYRLDSSNLDEQHQRNMIRARLIPVLERVAPQAVAAMARTALLLQADGAYLAEETDLALARLITSAPSGVTPGRRETLADIASESATGHAARTGRIGNRGDAGPRRESPGRRDRSDQRGQIG